MGKLKEIALWSGISFFILSCLVFIIYLIYDLITKPYTLKFIFLGWVVLCVLAVLCIRWGSK